MSRTHAVNWKTVTSVNIITKGEENGYYVSGNQQMAEDFVRGCTFMGTGGGGLPANGLQS